METSSVRERIVIRYYRDWNCLQFDYFVEGLFDAAKCLHLRRKDLINRRPRVCLHATLRISSINSTDHYNKRKFSLQITTKHKSQRDSTYYSWISLACRKNSPKRGLGASVIYKTAQHKKPSFFSSFYLHLKFTLRQTGINFAEPGLVNYQL